MKIIGKTENGFILDATMQEVANLVGFYSKFKVADIQVGREIDVHRMYHQLYELHHMEKQVGEIADQFEKYARELRPIMPIHIVASTEGE